MSNRQRIAIIALTVVLTVGIVFCGFGWRLVRQALDSAQAELASTRAALEGSGEELSETEGKLLTTEAELQDTQDYLAALETELKETKARLSAIRTDAFHLHNPTFEEAVSFLEEDDTDSNEYIEDEYVCSHFAGDVNNNAESQGIRCAFVDVRFPSSGHAVIAFDTTDRGLVYFDPITDERVRPVIGEEYWQCIEPRPGYHYEKPSFDDTIMDIVVIW